MELEKSEWQRLPVELRTKVFYQYQAKTRITYMMDVFLNSSFVKDLTSIIKHDDTQVRTPSHVILSGALWYKRYMPRKDALAAFHDNLNKLKPLLNMLAKYYIQLNILFNMCDCCKKMWQEF